MKEVREAPVDDSYKASSVHTMQLVIDKPVDCFVARSLNIIGVIHISSIDVAMGML